MTSMQKEFYGMEDYIQFAQNQERFEQNTEDGQPSKLSREMFMRLQIAKSASLFYSKWKINYANHFLGRCLDELHQVNLVK